MARKHRRIADFTVAAVFLVIVGLMLWQGYYGEAWAVHDSDLDQRRSGQLRLLYDVLDEQRKATGDWPADLETVRGRYLELRYEQNPGDRDRPLEDVPPERRPFVGFPPSAGPHRVEYFSPPLGGKVILRSYGHLSPTKGWDLRREPVTMDLDVRGGMRFHPVGSAGREPGSGA